MIKNICSRNYTFTYFDNISDLGEIVTADVNSFQIRFFRKKIFLDLVHIIVRNESNFQKWVKLEHITIQIGDLS